MASKLQRLSLKMRLFRSTPTSCRARQEKVGALADAIEVLRSELSEGPAPQKRIEAAARSADVSGATLRRAKKQLKIVSAKRGSKEWWVVPSRRCGGRFFGGLQSCTARWRGEDALAEGSKHVEHL